MNVFASEVVSMRDLFSPEHCWLLAMFCWILSMLPEWWDLHPDSRWWFYRRIYRHGMLYLSIIISSITVIRCVQLSPTLKCTAFSTLIKLICGVSILWGTLFLFYLVRWEYQRSQRSQRSLRRRELREIESRLDDFIYRSVGRFRVREDDDDFKCFTAD